MRAPIFGLSALLMSVLFSCGDDSAADAGSPLDSAPPDSALDTGLDSGTDGGLDSGADGGLDSGADGGLDAELTDASMPDDGGGADANDGEVDAPACATAPDPATPFLCPSGAPPPAQMGACCWRAHNACRLDAPELRIAALAFTTPPSIANPIMSAAFAAALDEENMNWGLQVAGADADGPVAIATGALLREAGGVYSFYAGTAPAPGSVDRWDATSTTGMLTGETLTASFDTLTVPVFDPDGSVAFELPFRRAQLERAVLSEQRSCVGRRRPTSYDAADGAISGFITVADALARRVDLPPIDASLCDLLAGQATDPAKSCATTPQNEWNVSPDALCMSSTCARGGCTSSTCNAWYLHAGMAAQGVEIEP